MIFDDTVINKEYSQHIELVRRQYSGNEHGVIKGIVVVNCLYFNPEIEQFWVRDYRIYDPENDKNGKIDHVKEMILDIVDKKKIALKTVLMESWYSSQTLMALIDDLGKIYYCPLKKNRLVDDTGGVIKYENLENLIWSEQELVSGKILKIRGFPRNKKVKLFWVTVSTNSTEYITTNDQNQSCNDHVELEIQTRWKIEDINREIKQLTGLESCQCRLRQIQRNHIACAMLAWNFLKKLATISGQTIYQLKHQLLSEYLFSEMKCPSIKITLI